MKIVQKLLPPGLVDGGRSFLQAPVLMAVLLPTQLPRKSFPHQDKVCGEERELVPTPRVGIAADPRAVPILRVPLLWDLVVLWGWVFSCE